MKVTSKLSTRRMLDALEHPERCDDRTWCALWVLANKRGLRRKYGVIPRPRPDALIVAILITVAATCAAWGWLSWLGLKWALGG